MSEDKALRTVYNPIEKENSRLPSFVDGEEILPKRMSETDKINENIKQVENKLIEKLLPSEIERIDFTYGIVWIK
jgi:hypothetical protein